MQNKTRAGQADGTKQLYRRERKGGASEIEIDRRAHPSISMDHGHKARVRHTALPDSEGVVTFAVHDRRTGRKQRLSDGQYKSVMVMLVDCQ